VSSASESLLQVENLSTWFYTRQGIVKAVDGVDFTVAAGETLAIVGESGCGKSMTALSLMRLIPEPPGRIVSGGFAWANATCSSSAKRRCAGCAATTSR
jgi:ABC-type dipeptide/oligopeptide/nickel transport system ATPase component